MSTISMTDVAYEVLNQYKKSVAFKDLWQKVAKQMGYNDQDMKKKMSSFYSKLSLDGRFVQKDNKWTLKSKVKYEDIVVEPDDENEEDEDDEIEEDASELDDTSENRSSEY